MAINQGQKDEGQEIADRNEGNRIHSRWGERFVDLRHAHVEIEHFPQAEVV